MPLTALPEPLGGLTPTGPNASRRGLTPRRVESAIEHCTPHWAKCLKWGVQPPPPNPPTPSPHSV
ncbi:MAG: hypothetical protein DRN53_06060, partial [Thermoprotei archaeon]